MSSHIRKLIEKNLVSPPAGWIDNSIQYETMMGSVAYGVSTIESDIDVYGFCIPPKKVIFPHLVGEIQGFGRQHKRFEQWQQHHILDKDAHGGKGVTWDFTIYSIVKFFQLVMDNNPNMLDALFAPEDCILHITPIGIKVRENRKLFLHKGCWHKLKGYAYSQLHKMKIKNPEPGSKRATLVEKFGYDVKFGYHVVRLVCEAEQILAEKDLDLRRSREQLKAIRRGEWSEKQVYQFFEDKERALEKLYADSDLPWGPDEDAIKDLLLLCLETHYGSLPISDPRLAEKSMEKIVQVANTYQRNLVTDISN